MNRLLSILILPILWSARLQGAEITLPHILFFAGSGVERVVEDTGGDFTVEFGTAANLTAARFVSDVTAALAAENWYWLTLEEFTFTASSTARATFTVGSHSEKADFTFRLYDSTHASHIPVRQLARTDYWIENPGTHEIFHEQRDSIVLNASKSGETYTLLRNGAEVAVKSGTGAPLVFPVSDPGSYTVRGSQNRIRGSVVLQLYSFLRTPQIQPQMNPVYLPGESLSSPLTFTFSPADPPVRSQLEALFAAFNDGEVSYWNPGIRITIVEWLADRFVVEIANSVNPGTEEISNDTRIPTGGGTFRIIQSSGGKFQSYDVQITASDTQSSGSVTLAGSEWGVDYRLTANTHDHIRILPGTGEALAFGQYSSGKYTVHAFKQGAEKRMPGDSLLLARPAGTSGRNAVRTVEYTDTCGRYTTNISYFDGLGYAAQTVEVRASGICDPHTGIPGDVVTPIHYDPLRRDNARIYLPYVAQGCNGEHQPRPFQMQAAFYDAQYADTCAYLANEFETAPSGRLLRSWRPGRIFRTADRSTSYVYASNAEADYVCRFRVSSAGDLVRDGYCAAAVLSKVSAVDEDGRVVERYADARSNMLLERRLIGAGNYADTYFVYDDRDSLRWVVPPECVERMQGATLSADDSLAVRYCYVYTYDERGNITEKRLPGSGPLRFVYDQGDRLVAMQDPNMRQHARWELYAYDAHNRETARYIAEGWTDEALRAKLAASGVASVSGKSPIAEIFYDDYPAAATPPAGITADTRTKGLRTFERLRIDDTQEFLTRTFYYDHRERCVQILERSPNYERTLTSGYDFRGNLTRTCETARAGAAPADTLIADRTYDDRGRLVAETTALNGATPVRSTYRYDKLGRLAVRRHADALTDSLGYDLRGWLVSQTNDYFAMRLHYHDPQQAATAPSFTGNITEWTFRHETDPQTTYAFSYDALSRLTDTRQYDGGTVSDRFVEKGITYDLNGNILTLQRTADGAVTDNLTYTYAGNRLSALSGTTSATYAYDANGNMTHDGAYGLDISYNRLNLIEKVEQNGGITAKYSYLSDGTKLSATDADGNGLYYLGSLVYRKQDGNYALESAAFGGGRFVASRTASGAACRPHYFITDHLGSVRAIVDADGEAIERSDYYPFGLRWNDPASTVSDNRYRYNGKEEQAFVNVPYTDYGARMYDPKYRLSWGGADPLAEKFFPFSPYSFCTNDPIKYIDPNGEEIWIYYYDENDIIQKIRYMSHMQYNGSNSFVAISVNYLNNIYSYGGSKVIDKLSESSNAFNVKEIMAPIDETVSFKESSKGGGDFMLGAIMASGFEKSQGIESFAHELFHGIQHEEGQSGTSIFNEVEAYIFGAGIVNNWMNAPTSDFRGGPNSLAGVGQANAAGTIYERAFNILTTRFSKETFNHAVINFKQGAFKNATGLYQNYPLIRRNQVNYLLPKFYPY